MPSQPRREDTQTSITYPAALERRLLDLLAGLKRRRLIHQSATRNQLALWLIARGAEQLERQIAAGEIPERIEV